MEDEMDMDVPQSAPSPTSSSQDQTSEPSVRQQKIIYTASARAQVENLDTALARITQMIAPKRWFSFQPAPQ